jgi:hypothetical protein
LRDVPQLFQLNGVGLRHLAGQLAEFPWVHELKLVDDRQILEVGVLDVEAFQRTLTVLADQSEIEIHQVKPPSGNLASAFEALVLQQKGWS